MSSRRVVSLTLLVPLAFCVLAARPAAAADPAGTCAASKRKAAGKKAAAKLNCYATAAKKGVGVDPDCITKAEEKFQAAFDKADAKGGCAGTGDAARIEGEVDTLVTQAATDIGVRCSKGDPLPCGDPSCPTGNFATCIGGNDCCGNPLQGQVCAAAICRPRAVACTGNANCCSNACVDGCCL